MRKCNCGVVSCGVVFDRLELEDDNVGGEGFGS